MFDKVGGLRPKRHFFDKSFPYKTTMKMGELVPFLAEEVVTGDRYKIGNNAVVRVSPMVAPILDNIYFRTEYFFVPERILAGNQEDFIKFMTGGESGDYSYYPFSFFENVPGNPNLFDGSLSDYFGLPKHYKTLSAEDDNVKISDKFHRAYVKVWNDFYRDENLQSEVSMGSIDYYMMPLKRNWRKDYFTSALLSPQRGTAPAVPIIGMLPISGGNPGVIFGDQVPDLTGTELVASAAHGMFRKFFTSGSPPTGGYATIGANSVTNSGSASDYYSKQNEVKGEKVVFAERDPDRDYAIKGRYTEADLSNNYVNLTASSGIGFNATDIRRLMQVQKFLERNMRAGALRFNEFLLAHFGMAPRDEVLQRPRFLGSTKTPIIVSEVLQTSESTSNSPQGRLSGKGLGLSAGMIGTHTFEEPGIVLGLMSIVPDLSYQSQGINKKFTRFTRYDYYFAEFAHLSEQPVKKYELMYDAEPSISTEEAEYENKNNKTFGYQGIYDDMRHNRGMVTGQFRSDATASLDYWHLARYFSDVPALNGDFITCSPSMRIFEVQDEDPFQVCLGNILKAIRPMPKIAEPGLVDHF